MGPRLRRVVPVGRAALLADFDAAAAQALEEVVKAERLGCAETGREIDPATNGQSEGVRLRVVAGENQLDAVVTSFPQATV